MWFIKIVLHPEPLKDNIVVWHIGWHIYATFRHSTFVIFWCFQQSLKGRTIMLRWVCKNMFLAGIW